jgi:hypothetical protein
VAARPVVERSSGREREKSMRGEIEEKMGHLLPAFDEARREGFYMLRLRPCTMCSPAEFNMCMARGGGRNPRKREVNPAGNKLKDPRGKDGGGDVGRR